MNFVRSSQGFTIVAVLFFLLHVKASTLPHGSPGVHPKIFDYGAQSHVPLISQKEKGFRISRRVGTLTDTAGDYDLALMLSDQLMPVQVAAGIIETFYQGVMGKSINYSLTNRSYRRSFMFRMGTLILVFRCLGADRSRCLPWPLVTMFAQCKSAFRSNFRSMLHGSKILKHFLESHYFPPKKLSNIDAWLDEEALILK